MQIQPKIEVSGLYKSFGNKRILQGVDFSLMPGESLVVIGGSGTGKSVLIKTIIGLMRASKGSIKIDGEETVKMTHRRRLEIMHKCGYLFQGGALFDSIPIWENVAFGLIYAEGMGREQAKEIAIQKIQQVGMGKEIANMVPAELSGGMQKRIALARAIATNPEIIFFDEPTTGLDPIMSDVINDLIIKCSKELKATTISITHDMQSAKKIADKMAMLYEGKLIWMGKPEDMYNSGNEYVDQFVHGRAEGPIQVQLQDH